MIGVFNLKLLRFRDCNFRFWSEVKYKIKSSQLQVEVDQLIMDQLAVYNSDSESENEETANTDEVHEQTSKSSGNNFFELDMHTSHVSTYDSLEKEQKSVHTLHVDGTSVEVPEGDFWTNLSEADILVRDDGVKAQKRKYESPVIPQSVSADKSVPHCSLAKRRQQDENMMMHQNTIHSNPNLGIASSLDPASTNSMRKSDFQPSDFRVKVYKVHPKISPYLNHQQSSRCACKVLHRWAGHAGVVNRIAWCSDPSFSHLLASASMDSTVRIWNAWGQQQPCVRTLTTHTRAVRDVQWSPDGRQVLSCSYDHTAAMTDVQTGQSQVQFEHSGFVSAGRFHTVTPHLVTTGTKDYIQVWDIRDPQVPVCILAHKEHMGQVQDLMFSSDGQELFSCGDAVARESADRTVMAWDFQTGIILSNQIFQERYTVTRLCMHPSHSQFLAQTQAEYIAVFSTQRPYKMNKNKRFEGHKTASFNIGVSLSQDGSTVYSGSSDGKLYCYNFSTGKMIRTLDCGEVLLDVASHPVLPSVVAGATWAGDILIYQ